MVIFAEIVLFCLAIYLSMRFVTNEIRIKALKVENEKLIEQNEELRDLLLSDEPRVEIPEHIARKKILHG
jgi:hypothetical protein